MVNVNVEICDNITSNNLPKIGLPTFSGNITVFQSDIDLYDSLIHNNSNLSDCEKFTYLLSTLRGTAYTIVQHLPVFQLYHRL